MEKRKCIAYIPARGGSKRIPKKNIKLLDDKPIIMHVIELLEKLPFIDVICVSTDDNEIINAVQRDSVITLEKRLPEISNDFCGFLELVKKDIPRYEKHLGFNKGYDVLMVLPTAALLDRKDLEESYDKFLLNRYQFLFAAKSYEISAFWAFSEKDNGVINPLFPEYLNERSQDLTETFSDAGLFYFLNSEYIYKAETTWFHGNKIGYSLVDSSIAIDVDTEKDWERLEDHYFKQK